MKLYKKLLPALLISAFTLGACSTPEETTKSSETPSETLVIYSGRSEDLVSPLISEFEKESGIKTEVRYLSSTEAAQLLLTEKDATSAHVFLSQESGALGLLENAGLLSKLPTETTNKVPSQYSSKNNNWVGLTARARVVAYDSQTLSETEVPNSADELIDPKWAGQIGIAPTNASFIAFITAMRLERGEEATATWLQNLADQGVRTYNKNGEILDAVNRGEVQLGLINHYYWFGLAKELGAEQMRAQIHFTKAKDVASLVNATGVGIVKKAGDNPQAIAFVNYLLSDAGQTYFAQEEYEYPLVAGINAPDGLKPLSELQGPDVDLSDLNTVVESTALIEAAGLTVQTS